MQKLEIIFLGFLAMKLVSTQMTPVEIVHHCLTQEKATDNDLGDWLNNVTPKSQILKCFESCVAEQTGQFVDNKLNVLGMKTDIDERFKDPKTNAIYKDIVNECKSITDNSEADMENDRCEMVAKVLNCLADGARKRGVDEL